MADQVTAESIHILVIPSFGQILVTPVAMIEEVLPIQEIKKNTQMPDIFTGTIDWRGKSVGLTSYTRLAGGKMEKPEPHNRIVVFKPLEGCEPDQQFAFLINSDPEPRAVSRMDLQKDVNAPSDNPLIISHCTLDGRAVGIPDVAEWRKRLCFKSDK